MRGLPPPREPRVVRIILAILARLERHYALGWGLALGMTIAQLVRLLRGD